jgi:hypothetical protein
MARELGTTLLTTMLFCIMLQGCGGGSQQTAVTITPKPSTVAAGSQTTFTATILNLPKGSADIGWYLVPTSAAGTLTLATNSGSNTSTISYNAPPTAPSTNSVRITAYSIQDRSALDTVTFSITGSALPVIQTVSFAMGTVGMAYPATNLQASNGTGPYTWTIASGLLPPGMNLTSDGVLSGTPGAAGSFPITLEATDSVMNSGQAQVTLTINFPMVGTCGSPLGHEAALNGEYAFLLQGFDTLGPTAVVGSFTADGTGNVTSGQEDRNIANGLVAVNLSVDPTASNFTLDSVNRGCLTLSTSAGVFVYRLSAVTDSSGNAVEGYLMAFDSNGVRVQGTFKKQDPTDFSTNQINGSYSFGVSSDLSKNGRFAAVGSFTASASTLNSGAIDTNVTGNVDETGIPQMGTPNYPAAPMLFAGNYSIGADGRGSMTFNLQDATNTTMNVVAYVVSATELYVMRSDPQFQPLFSGRIVQQASAPYSASSLNGTMVRYMGGLSTLGVGSREELDLVSVSTPGSYNFSSDYNDGGNNNTNFSIGTYAVDGGTGRVQITGDIFNVPLCYLYGLNQGFCMGTTNQVSFGELLPQTGGPFSSASLNGIFAFGTEQSPSVEGNFQIGAAGGTSPGSLNVLTDENAAGSILTLRTQTSPSYFLGSTGTGVLNSGSSVIYAVSPQLFLVIDEGVVTSPTLTFYQQ